MHCTGIQTIWREYLNKLDLKFVVVLLIIFLKNANKNGGGAYIVNLPTSVIKCNL